MVAWLFKGPTTLIRRRIIFAILIALSLTLAPITSAQAAAQMRASMSANADAIAVSDDAMTDCMKAMQAQKPATGSDCACCDGPSQAPCDMGACLAKCSVHLIGILAPPAEIRFAAALQHLLSAPQKPPDWSLAPPAPPPRT